MNVCDVVINGFLGVIVGLLYAQSARDAIGIKRNKIYVL